MKIKHVRTSNNKSLFFAEDQIIGEHLWNIFRQTQTEQDGGDIGYVLLKNKDVVVSPFDENQFRIYSPLCGYLFYHSGFIKNILTLAPRSKDDYTIPVNIEKQKEQKSRLLFNEIVKAAFQMININDIKVSTSDQSFARFLKEPKDYAKFIFSMYTKDPEDKLEYFKTFGSKTFTKLCKKFDKLQDDRKYGVILSILWKKMRTIEHLNEYIKCLEHFKVLTEHRSPLKNKLEEAILADPSIDDLQLLIYDSVTIDTVTFSDCGEISLCNFLRIIVHHRGKDILKTLGADEVLVKFFEDVSYETLDSKEKRQQWAAICSNIDGVMYNRPEQGQATYEIKSDDNYEEHMHDDNMLKVIKHLLPQVDGWIRQPESTGNIYISDICDQISIQYPEAKKRTIGFLFGSVSYEWKFQPGHFILYKLESFDEYAESSYYDDLTDFVLSALYLGKAKYYKQFEDSLLFSNLPTPEPQAEADALKPGEPTAAAAAGNNDLIFTKLLTLLDVDDERLQRFFDVIILNGKDDNRYREMFRYHFFSSKNIERLKMHLLKLDPIGFQKSVNDIKSAFTHKIHRHIIAESKSFNLNKLPIKYHTMITNSMDEESKTWYETAKSVTHKPTTEILRSEIQRIIQKDNNEVLNRWYKENKDKINTANDADLIQLIKKYPYRRNQLVQLYNKNLIEYRNALLNLVVLAIKVERDLSLDEINMTIT